WPWPTWSSPAAAPEPSPNSPRWARPRCSSPWPRPPGTSNVTTPATSRKGARPRPCWTRSTPIICVRRSSPSWPTPPAVRRWPTGHVRRAARTPPIVLWGWSLRHRPSEPRTRRGEVLPRASAALAHVLGSTDSDAGLRLQQGRPCSGRGGGYHSPSPTTGVTDSPDPRSDPSDQVEEPVLEVTVGGEPVE